MKKGLGIALLSLTLLAACSNEAEVQPVTETPDKTEVISTNKDVSVDNAYLFGKEVEQDYTKLNKDDKDKVDLLKESITNKSVVDAETEMLELMTSMSTEAKEIVFLHYVQHLQEMAKTDVINGEPLKYYQDQEIEFELYEFFVAGKNIEVEEFLDEGVLSDKAREALEEVYFNSLRLVEKTGFIFVGIDSAEILKKFEEVSTPQFESYVKYNQEDQDFVHINKEGVVFYEDINKRATLSLEGSESNPYYKELYENDTSFYLSWMIGYYDYLVTSEPLDYSKLKEALLEFEESNSLAYKEIKNFIDLLKANNYTLNKDSLAEVEKILTKFTDSESLEYILKDLKEVNLNE